MECSVDELLAKHLAVLLIAAGAPLVGRAHHLRQAIPPGKLPNLVLQATRPLEQDVLLAGSFAEGGDEDVDLLGASAKDTI